MNPETMRQKPTGNDVMEMLIAPIESEAHHQQVCESLDYARKIGDLPAVTILLAQLSHSQSWRPNRAAQASKPETVVEGAS